MAYFVVVTGFVSTSLAAYAKWKAYRARKDAEILLCAASKLRPGEATIADAEGLARSHSSFFMKGSPSRRMSALYFDFWYDNRLLWKLHLAPRVVFSIHLQVVDRSLDAVNVALDSDLSTYPHFYRASVWAFTQDAYPGDPGYILARRDQWTSIRLKPSATPEQRKKAYSFNLKCLDKLGGCHDEKELFPGPWQIAK